MNGTAEPVAPSRLDRIRTTDPQWLHPHNERGLLSKGAVKGARLLS